MSVKSSGLLKAVIDAIFGSDNALAGTASGRLTAPMSAASTSMSMRSTLGFGEYEDGTGNALLAIEGEILSASGRTDTTFTGLSRALQGTAAGIYPIGTVVRDVCRNTSALDRLRRGMLVNWAVGPDLDVIARNLGLHRCPDMDDDETRKLISDIAYLAKCPLSAIQAALEVLYTDSNILVYERIMHSPFTVFAQIVTTLATSLRGRFFLNGGERAVTAGGHVIVQYPIRTLPVIPSGTLGVFGVYPSSYATRRGIREGQTNYFTGGSYTGSNITLGSNPGDGVPVIVDYNAFPAHFLAPDESFRNDGTAMPPYLADDFVTARCLVDQVRQAGVAVVLQHKVTS